MKLVVEFVVSIEPKERDDNKLLEIENDIKGFIRQIIEDEPKVKQTILEPIKTRWVPEKG